MKGVEKKIKEKWELFVEKWLDTSKSPDITIEKVKAYEKDCNFFTEMKTEIEEKIKTFLLQVSIKLNIALEIRFS